MHRAGSSRHPPHEADWIWAEMGGGPFCNQAQADGVPCFELGRDCRECEKGREGWLRLQEARHSAKTLPQQP